MKKTSTATQEKNLAAAAARARENAYAPYSRCAVGAALVTTAGRVHAGCNVENSSFGATICAERNAIHAAVAAGDLGPAAPRARIAAVLVLTESNPGWPPCGMCRQVIAEFAAPDAVVHVHGTRGGKSQHRFADLLPHPFTPEHVLTERK